MPAIPARRTRSTRERQTRSRTGKRCCFLLLLGKVVPPLCPRPRPSEGEVVRLTRLRPLASSNWPEAREYPLASCLYLRGRYDITRANGHMTGLGIAGSNLRHCVREVPLVDSSRRPLSTCFFPPFSFPPSLIKVLRRFLGHEMQRPSRVRDPSNVRSGSNECARAGCTFCAWSN